MTAFQQDIAAAQDFATKTDSLAALMPVLCDVLKQNGYALVGITFTYRFQTVDTGFTAAFALRNGVYSDLNADDAADVTISGKEADLLAVFQRRLNPVKALLFKKSRLRATRRRSQNWRRFCIELLQTA